MSLQGENLSDLVAGVTKRLGRMKINDLLSQYAEYVDYNDCVKGGKSKWEGTYSAQAQLLVDGPNNFAWSPLYESYNLDNADTVKSISAPLRFCRTGWTIDDRVVAMNIGGNGAEKIIDLVMTQRTVALIRLADGLEVAVWGKPTGTADDTKPWGIGYWVDWTTGTAGFTGGIPAGFADVGGQSPTTYPAHSNWSATYVNYTEDDLLDKLRTSMLRTNWKPPVSISEYSTGLKRAWYGGITNHNELVKLTRGQNENLRQEVVNFHGGLPVINGVPYKYVPALDDTAIINSGSDPFYGLDWGTFEIIGVKGYNMKEYPPMRNASQPTVVKTHLFHSFQMLCNKRRNQIVIAKSEPQVN